MTTIDPRIELIDAERRELLALAESLAPDVLVAKPVSGGWSVLQVVEHLVIAEREVLGGLVPPDELVGRPRRLRHRVRYWIVMLVLRSPIRVPVPSPTMVPAGGRPLAQLRRLWDENLAWVRAYAAGLGDGHDPAVFRHPVCGPITLKGALGMDLIHVRNHRRQIDRILASVGAAAGSRP